MKTNEQKQLIKQALSKLTEQELVTLCVNFIDIISIMGDDNPYNVNSEISEDDILLTIKKLKQEAEK